MVNYLSREQFVWRIGVGRWNHSSSVGWAVQQESEKDTSQGLESFSNLISVQSVKSKDKKVELITVQIDLETVDIKC